MRRFLFSGLFMTLGFSLSWNPEFHQFGRNQQVLSGERALASETEAAKLSKKELHSFDLAKIDSSKKGFTVKYEITQFGKEKKVAYFVEQTEGDSSETCSDCLGLNKTYIETFSADNIENIELINRLVGEMAVAKITIKKEDKTPVKKEEKKKDEVTSACGEADSGLELSESDKALLGMSGANTSTDYSNSFACKADEYQTLAQECQEMMEKSVSDMAKDEVKAELKQRRECLTKAAKYYNKFIKKDLEFGLSAKATPEQYAVASSFRDGILRNTPAAMNGLKNEVLKISQAGLLERTKAYFMSRMANPRQGDTANSIATEAKVKMITEMRSSSAANFCAAYSGASSAECMTASSQPQARAQLAFQNSVFGSFNSTYLTPMEKFASAQGGTEAEFDKMIASIGLSTTTTDATGMAINGTPTGTIDPNMPLLQGAPTGTFEARTGVPVRGSTNAMLPVPGSVSVTQGQIIIPGVSSTQSQVQYPTSFAQPTTALPTVTAPAITAPTAVAPAIVSPVTGFSNKTYPTTSGVVTSLPSAAAALPRPAITQPMPQGTFQPGLPAQALPINR